MLFIVLIGKQLMRMRTCMTILEHKALRARACDRMTRRACTTVSLVTVLIVCDIVSIIEKHDELITSTDHHGPNHVRV